MNEWHRKFPFMIRAEHLDAAIARIKLGVDHSHGCLMAVAASEALKDDQVSWCFGFGYDGHGHSVTVSERKLARTLVKEFDSGNYDAIRQTLPLPIMFVMGDNL